MNEEPSVLLLMGIGVVIMLAFIAFLWALNAVKVWLRRVPQARSAPPLTRPYPPKGQAPAPASPALLSLPDWLTYVNDQPDRVPHLAIIGGSGAGKTTLATAVLADRPGSIVVLTAKEGDGWGGLPYIGIDDDATYTTADRTFTALDAEVKGRLVAVKARQEPGGWLTVVLDDYSTLRAVCPAADGPFKLIARIGRALRVRLIVLSDSANVKAWGIEGEGETRANFAFLRLSRERRGTLERDDQETPIDTAPIPDLAEQADLQGRAWYLSREAFVDERRPATETSAPVSSSLSSTQIASIAGWLIYEPEISNREIARRLWPETDGGGRYAVKAKEAREIIERVLLEGVLSRYAVTNAVEQPEIQPA